MKKSRNTIIKLVLLFLLLATFVVSWKVIAAPLAPDIYLSQADIIFDAESAGDNLGASLAGIGDINGDGLPDLALGAPLNDNDEGGRDAGKVYIFFGTSEGWTRYIHVSQADVSFIGEQRRAMAGKTIAAAGDVNNDGFADFLISAPGDVESGDKAGQSYLILGKADGWSLNASLGTADASFWGENAGDESGSALDGVGDVNGDGFDDFLIGAPNSNSSGQAYLVFGRANGWTRDISLSLSDASFLGESTTGHAASTLAGVGDVNGDGYDDFLIGDWSRNSISPNDGETYLILGKSDGWQNGVSLANADASFIGEALGFWSGYSVDGAGDVNNDGYDDIIIGAPGNDDNGRQTGETYVILGKSQGWSMRTPLSSVDASFRPEWEYTWTGAKVASLGDINQDGYDDFAAGAILSDERGFESGKIYLVLGKGQGWSQDSELNATLTTYLGENSFDLAGSAISDVGDFNNDGRLDLIIGAPFNDSNGLDSGRAYILFGNNKPSVGQFAVDKPFDNTTTFITLRASYYDIMDGVSDLNAVEIYIESEGKRVLARFNPISNKLWLREGKSGWLGSCVLGQSGFLTGKFIQLNCGTTKATVVNLSELIVDWSIRVIRLPKSPKVSISLRAVDQSGQESGIQSSGFWNISSEVREYDLSEANISFLGEFPRDTSGWDVAFAGDVNGDGLGDILIGAPHNSENAPNGGKIYLFFGREDNFNGIFSTSEADASFLSEESTSYNNAGYAIDGVGDVNGDGLDDFIIGAWTNEEAGITAGQVYLILGKTSGWATNTPLDQADASFLPSRGSTYFGCALSGVGDVNGDQLNDFIIGGWGYGTSDAQQTGAVWLILGKRDGWSMDTPMSEATASFIGESKNNWAGYSVAGAGDVNQDGYDDFLIGAPRNGEIGIYAGKAYLILGKESGWSLDTSLSNADASFLAEDAYDLAGFSLSGAGDVNNDGFDDFLITALGDDSGGGSEAGKVYLFFGKSSGWSNGTSLAQADASFVGEYPFDRAGQGLSGLGDVNQDEYDDFAIGAPGADDGGNAAGKIYIVLGKGSGWSGVSSLSSASLFYWGESKGDRAGQSIAGLKNFIGQDSIGLLIGAPGNDESGFYNAGKSYVILLKGSDSAP